MRFIIMELSKCFKTRIKTETNKAMEVLETIGYEKGTFSKENRSHFLASIFYNGSYAPKKVSEPNLVGAK